MARLRLAVFDCDGTLVDSQHMIVAAMVEAFAGQRMPAPDPRLVRRVVGLSLPEAVARLLPEADPALVLSLSDQYKAAFRRLREGGGREPLYKGAREAVEILVDRGYILGIATGKSRRGLHAALAHHKLTSFFSTLQTADDAPGKPHPAMLEQAMAAAGADPRETIMIGDTTFDMIMARAARTAAVGVSWGYHEAAELKGEGAAAVVDDFADLAPVLDGLLLAKAEA